MIILIAFYDTGTRDTSPTQPTQTVCTCCSHSVCQYVYTKKEEPREFMEFDDPIFSPKKNHRNAAIVNRPKRADFRKIARRNIQHK